MSSSSSPSTILISAIFLLSLMSNIASSSSSSSPLIEEACANPRLGTKSLSCVQLLETQSKVDSAKNLYSLSLAIMKSGISSATETRKQISTLLESAGPEAKVPLQNCKTAYDDIIKTFSMALDEVKEDKEYDTATYDLLIGCTDSFQPCLDAAAAINDPSISSGNDVTMIHALAAYQAIEKIPTLAVMKTDNNL